MYMCNDNKVGVLHELCSCVWLMPRDRESFPCISRNN